MVIEKEISLKQSLNLNSLLEQYRYNAKTAKAGEKLLNAIRKNNHNLLKDSFKYYQQEPEFKNDQSLSKDEIDLFLKFYSILQLSILTDYVSQPLPGSLQEEINLILGNEYVKDYYTEYYPNLLLQLLYNSVQNKKIQKNIGGASSFVNLLLTDQYIDEDIEKFLSLLDYGEIKGYQLNDFKNILKNDEEVELILAGGLDENDLSTVLFWGFLKYITYLENYENLLRKNIDNELLCSAFWHFNGDRFERIYKTLGSTYKQCISLLESSSLARIKNNIDYEKDNDFAQLCTEIIAQKESIIESIDFVTNPIHGKAIKDLVIESKNVVPYLKSKKTDPQPQLYRVPGVHQAYIKMCFLYIGSNEGTVEHLSHHFESGYRETNFGGAITFIQVLTHERKRLPDVILIDVPFNESELNHFHAALSYNVLFNNVPVIYNDKQLSDNQILRLNHLKLIDDIIKIDSNEIDYFSKITFLKQSKLFDHFYATSKVVLNRKKKSVAKMISSVLKRGIDILVASLCIVILSPIFILIAILIKLESKGPVFYSALRAGKGFKVFKFYKFRSMVADADKDIQKLLRFNQYASGENGPIFFKVKSDPRVTKFGRILRNTSADELPLLFNVLKGDMSLVGNRPLPLYEAEKLTTNEFVERFNAPAGITGLWQVKKRGKADLSAEERINMDIVYSRDSNFFYDLKILAKAPIALFQKSDL